MLSLRSFSSSSPTQCKRLATSVLAAEQGNTTEGLSGYYWNCPLIILLLVYRLPVLCSVYCPWIESFFGFISVENRHCICLLRWWDGVNICTQRDKDWEGTFNLSFIPTSVLRCLWFLVLPIPSALRASSCRPAPWITLLCQFSHNTAIHSETSGLPLILFLFFLVRLCLSTP